jgi:peptide-methionine (S)-S-oxide reductase
MTQTIVFGGGCFWCTEAVFQRLKGVKEVKPGYANCNIENPSYEEVASGQSGCAEAAHVVYNPEQISLSVLLDVFFSSHDPTTLNRQGHDVGTQYRSGVYYTSEDQKKEIMDYIHQLERDEVFKNPIVTEVEPLKNYYEAENYHLNYYNNNRNAPYCQVVIDPKIKKLKEKFAPLLK